MTKRDVTIWFCKVVALVGISISAINFLSDFFGFGIVGGHSIRHLMSAGFYLFLWLFSAGIGTELAAEGEHGAPIVSGAELKPLLLRCVGLWLLISGSVWFGYSLFSVIFESFFNRTPTMYMRVMMPNLISGFVQSLLGFLLAFTPRIRTFLQK
ncbi:MAG TPA: hypothetical protein VGB45_12780 [Abditibacterium sp.]|jgi:hypothetical protein